MSGKRYAVQVVGEGALPEGTPWAIVVHEGRTIVFAKISALRAGLVVGRVMADYERSQQRELVA